MHCRYSFLFFISSILRHKYRSCGKDNSYIIWQIQIWMFDQSVRFRVPPGLVGNLNLPKETRTGSQEDGFWMWLSQPNLKWPLCRWPCIVCFSRLLVISKTIQMRFKWTLLLILSFMSNWFQIFHKIFSFYYHVGWQIDPTFTASSVYPRGQQSCL